jgi:hypothetical protein
MAESLVMVSRHLFLTPPTDRFLTLLALLVAMLLVTGIEGRYTPAAVGVLTTAVLVVAFRSVGLASSYGRLAVLGLIGLSAVATSAVFDVNQSAGAIGWLIQAAILSAIAMVVARRVLDHTRVQSQTIAGALCFYVLIGLVFGMLFGAAEAWTDHQILFTDGVGRADPVYYSFVTLTTVGFGDVTSSADFVRRATVMEAMIGQVFLATMVARLVALYGMPRRFGQS